VAAATAAPSASPSRAKRSCGVYPFHDATVRPGEYRVNLGCIEGIDPLSLPIETIDGRAL
jgi:hypothetical protein